MAKGKKCPYCKLIMYAQSEKQESKGTYVIYICRNRECNHKEKIFESN